MTTDRSRTWASTMAGYRTAGPDASARPGSAVVGGEVLPHPHGTAASGPGIRRAHAGSSFLVGPLGRGWSRLDKEAFEAEHLVAGATRSHGAGRRLVDEEPDATRTCFERDRDRILHSSAFRRLAGKTQVFVFPDDHQRTRLTHAIEVAQVATSLASALHLNLALTEAIALGHDCGHGPGGHASEDALDPYVDEGYDHAVWGADVVLTPLNLCQETLDGIRNHSWSRPTPSTPEAEIVAWADRIAYVCHDFEDAVSAGLVTPDRLPEAVRRRCGSTRRLQLASFIEAVVEATISTGEIGMHDDVADALAAFRLFNYEHIYLRPSSVEQGNRVVRLLRALVEHYAAHPGLLPPSRLRDIDASSPEAFREAVTYVGGMTDRFACTQAVALVGYPVNDLPTGFDLPTR